MGIHIGIPYVSIATQTRSSGWPAYRTADKLIRIHFVPVVASHNQLPSPQNRALYSVHSFLSNNRYNHNNESTVLADLLLIVTVFDRLPFELWPEGWNAGAGLHTLQGYPCSGCQPQGQPLPVHATVRLIRPTTPSYSHHQSLKHRPSPSPRATLPYKPAW